MSTEHEKEKKEPKAPAKLSVDQWAEVKFPSSNKGHFHPDRWKHGAAAALHGWTLHAHHNDSPMQLTEVDYDKSIKAIEEMVPDPSYKNEKDKENKYCPKVYVPHDGALYKNKEAK